MSLYSRRRGWVSRDKRPVDTGPNPYDLSSPLYRERNRETSTSLPGGLVRVDIGTPIPRLPNETQPVPKSDVPDVPSNPETMAGTLPAEHCQSLPAPRKRPREPREQRAITREP